jgi:hypothetical protein
MPIVAGMVTVMEALTGLASVELAAQSWGAAAQDLLQDLALTWQQASAGSFQIFRKELAQEWMETERTGSLRFLRQERRHGRAVALEIVHELIEPFLMLSLAETGEVGVDGGDVGTFVAEVDLDLAEVFSILHEMGGVGMS